MVPRVGGLGGRRLDAGGLRHAGDGLGEPRRPHRLEQVVDGPQREGLHGGVVVRRHEDDRRRDGETAQDAGELEPGQPGHADVEEHAVDRCVLERLERRDGVAGRAHLLHPRVGAQQVGELVERGRLVVDGEQPQRGRRRHEAARTPGLNFGTRTVTFVPAPTAVSTTSPCSSPYTARSRASTFARPIEAWPGGVLGRAGEHLPHPLGVAARAVVLDRDAAQPAVVLGHDRDRAAAAAALEAVLHGVLDERLQAQVRHGDGQHLRRHAEHHLQPVAEARLLEQQVAVDRPQLLGQRRVLAVRAARVAGEVGEVEQQLAGPLRVGAHERRDGGERVEDEVRADLRPQRPHLRLGEPRARLVELGELELPRHPAGDLADRRHQPGARGRAVRADGADHALVEHERRDDAGAHRAVGIAADEVVRHRRAARRQRRLRVAQGGDRVHLPGALPDEQRLGVGERHGRARQQRPQVPGARRRRRRVQAGAQRGRREARLVQRGVGGALLDGPERPAAARRPGHAGQAEHDGERDHRRCEHAVRHEVGR